LKGQIGSTSMGPPAPETTPAKKQTTSRSKTATVLARIAKISVLFACSPGIRDNSCNFKILLKQLSDNS